MSMGQYCYPTQDGDYKVVVGNNGSCYAASALYNVSYTGVESVGVNTELVLSPNPNTGAFTLSAHIDGNATIIITDISGRVLMMQDIVAKNGAIDQEVKLDDDVAPGLYFLKLSSENYNKVISFVKQ
jgi:5-formaminoimidazole-4-carboxamide-1-beta-D-ribofuranosyl 5'-monophosphate synthetase